MLRREAERTAQGLEASAGGGRAARGRAAAVRAAARVARRGRARAGRARRTSCSATRRCAASRSPGRRRSPSSARSRGSARRSSSRTARRARGASPAAHEHAPAESATMIAGARIAQTFAGIRASRDDDAFRVSRIACTRRTAAARGDPRMIAVRRERIPGERRVAATPETVTQLIGIGLDVESREGRGRGGRVPRRRIQGGGGEAASRRSTSPRSTCSRTCARSTANDAKALKAGAVTVGLGSPASELPPSAPCATEGHLVRPRTRAAHLARAVDGRPHLAGSGRRLPLRARGGHAAARASSRCT